VVLSVVNKLIHIAFFYPVSFNLWGRLSINISDPIKLWTSGSIKLGEDGVAVADTAWGVGSELVMTSYTVADGNTESRQLYDLCIAQLDVLLKRHLDAEKIDSDALSMA
jgi:hypothetical protein